jgi:hypothetical protein
MKLLLITLLAIGSFTSAQAQCNQHLVFRAPKTEFLNALMEVKNTSEEAVEVDITPTTITITPNQDAQSKMTGKIKSTTCNWPTAFKEGKMTLVADLSDPSGETMEVTITIEAKQGKTTFIATTLSMPDHIIRMQANSFGEAK